MNWLDTIIKALLSAIAFLLIAGILFMLVSALRRLLRIRHEREHQIKIHHKANFRAFYYLAVEAPQHPDLHFRFLAGKLPLVEVSQPAVETQSAVASSAAPAKGAAKSPKIANPAISPTTQQKLEESGSQAVAKAGTVSNMLGALAGLLPGKLGDGIRQRQDAVRQAQEKAAGAMQVPKQLQQRVMVIQSESQKLGVKPGAAQPASPANAAAGTPSTHSARAEQVPSADEQRSLVYHPPFGGLYCVQTVELEPEQTLPLKLMISPASRKFPVGSFAYNIHLQAVPLEPLQEKIPALSRRGIVSYASVAAWRSLLPNFVSALVILLGLLFWLYLLTLIW